MSGRLFVIAAPSGAGKTSLVKAALERESNLRVCVSHTTRPKRPNEIDGRDYHFIDVPTFKTLIDADGFLEYAPVFDNFYGTSRAALAEAFGRGHDVILEIDWQGALQIRRAFANAVLIFILPPSWEELRARLERRGEDAPEVIALRLKNAAEEMAQAREFDFVIINELFERALFDLKAIVHAQRLKYPAQRRARADTFKALHID